MRRLERMYGSVEEFLDESLLTFVQRSMSSTPSPLAFIRDMYPSNWKSFLPELWGSLKRLENRGELRVVNQFNLNGPCPAPEEWENITIKCS